MDAEKKLKIDEESIIKSAIEGSGLPLKSIEDYSQKELVCLARQMTQMIRSLILGQADISEDAREILDTLMFRAGKDSTNSSMRPSSDFGRKTSTEEGDAVNDCVGSTDPGSKDDCDGSQAEDDTDNTDEDEREAEERLHADHDRSRRTKSGRSVGRQTGEKGQGFSIPERIDRQETIVLIPDECKCCGHQKECLKNPKTKSVHNEYDIEVSIVKRTTIVPEMECCKEDGEKKSADPPKDAKGVNQYGVNIRTLVVLLYTVGMVSLNRIHDIVAPMFGIRLSETTILSYVHKLAGKVKTTVDGILKAEEKMKVVHCDETGSRVGTQMHWIHCVSSQLYTFVSLQEKRGKEALDAIGFLTTYVGTVVHDCLSSYWLMDEENEKLTHAVCNGHIERELKGLSKFFHNASLWADDMLALMQEMLHRKHTLKSLGEKCISPESMEEYSKRYDELIERGKKLHPIPEKKEGKRGRVKKGRARCLIERMELRKPEIFRFLTDFDVPYTNNEAERSFRLLAIRKNVGIFRNIENAKEFCLIWSYVSTAKKHGHSYYKAIYEAFNDRGYELIFSNEEGDNGIRDAA